MEILIAIIAISYIAGLISCHAFWKWHQSSEIRDKVTELKSAKISRNFCLGGGITFNRPGKIGISQEGAEGKLHGISEINIIEHDGFVEIFGSWNRNGNNQIDPYSLYLPTSLDVIDPEKLVEFGKYFVDLGEKINNEIINK